MPSKVPYKAGLSKNGLPCIRIGDHSDKLVIFTSGSPDGTIPTGVLLWLFVDGAKRFAERYTVYFVKRKQGLSPGYTTADMARDYADFVRGEIGGPCRIVGISTGGFIAQHFAVTYPDLVEKLVIAIAGYRLQGRGRELVREWRRLADRNRLTKLLASMYASTTTGAAARFATLILAAVMGGVMRRRVPDLQDFVVTLDALLAHDAGDVLSQIRAPVLIIGGEVDFFYPAETLKEMHGRMPGSELVIYEGAGHGLMEYRKDDFERDVMSFLEDER